MWILKSRSDKEMTSERWVRHVERARSVEDLAVPPACL